MPHYMIHTCKQREWYVQQYLVPSLLEQGIPKRAINIRLDKDEIGCLESTMKAFQSCVLPGGTWHLQDDIIISDDFAEMTDVYDYGIVCGIATTYDKDRKNVKGLTDIYNMWYSFPCIRIPNRLAVGCGDWFYAHLYNNPVYKDLVHSKKRDDEVFRMYIETVHKDVTVVNLSPNIVDHIDYLIGGSTVNQKRTKDARALYFSDTYKIKELENMLKKNNA